jgi:hypothetical protein
MRRAASNSIAWLFLCAYATSLSCASTTPHLARTSHSRDPSLARCPGDTPMGCPLTVTNCQYDEANQCQLCVCAPIMQTTQQVQAAPFTQP